MKNEGFILLESIISVFIILLISTLVTNVIKSNYILVSNQKEEIEILNTLRSNLEITKKKIKLGELVTNKTFNQNNYKIEKIIEESNYYTKVYLKVNKGDKFMDIISYVYKQ